jgi:hypothetical protein
MGEASPRRRRSVREILVERKLLGDDALSRAEEDSRKKNQPLQQSILDLGLLSKAVLVKILSEEWGVKAIDLALVVVDLDKEIARIIPEAVARRHRAVPIAREGDALSVAMADPNDALACEEINLRTGYEVRAYLAMPGDITQALDSVYHDACRPSLRYLARSLEARASDRSVEPEPDKAASKPLNRGDGAPAAGASPRWEAGSRAVPS